MGKAWSSLGTTRNFFGKIVLLYDLLRSIYLAILHILDEAPIFAFYTPMNAFVNAIKNSTAAIFAPCCIISFQYT